VFPRRSVLISDEQVSKRVGLSPRLRYELGANIESDADAVTPESAERQRIPDKADVRLKVATGFRSKETGAACRRARLVGGRRWPRFSGVTRAESPWIPRPGSNGSLSHIDPKTPDGRAAAR